MHFRLRLRHKIKKLPQKPKVNQQLRIVLYLRFLRTIGFHYEFVEGRQTLCAGWSSLQFAVVSKQNQEIRNIITKYYCQ